MQKIILKISKLLLGFLFFSNFIFAQQDNIHKPYVVILSMDGFRWDYPEKANTPNLDKIAADGVRAKAFIPCFPTKTFPNHYTMATGLYAENHGIVLNKFFANDLGKKYKITNPEFYSGEPIWATAEKQGVKSASFFWLGSEAPIEKSLPTYTLEYNEAVPFESRVDSIINWLQLPEEERPHLIMWYMHEPDEIGNNYGPNSKQVITMVEYLDKLIGEFVNRVNKLPIADDINLVFLSDHGMGEIEDDDKAIYLNNYINKDWINYLDGVNPIFLLDIKDEFEDSVYTIIKNIPHVSAWKRDEVPSRLHFSNNVRIKDFVIVADSGWTLWPMKENQVFLGGAHGYDNQNSDMHAIFYAIGPAFKKGFISEPINNVDLYPLICRILNLVPAKNEGSIDHVIPMLK